jgi:prevent-host-death family protein
LDLRKNTLLQPCLDNPDQTKSGLAMKTINIQAAKTHLSRLVEEAVAGEEIILAKAGKPLVRLIPYAPAKAARIGGQLAGRIWVAPDCWASDEDPFAESLATPFPASAPALVAAEEQSPYRLTKG